MRTASRRIAWRPGTTAVLLGSLALTILALAVLTFPSVGAAQQTFPVLEGPYMGQDPPGMTPEIFLPGILSDDARGAFCTVFSPGLDEFYFVWYAKGTEDTMQMHHMERTENRWSAPQPLGLSLRGMDNDLCLSEDGNRMIFRSWRRLPDGSVPDDHSWLWVTDREDGVWGEARPFLAGGAPVNSGYPSMARNGSIYFRYRVEGIQGIYRSRIVEGEYAAPEHVVTLFRSDFVHGDMFIAPDESYMIVSGMEPEIRADRENLELYVLFRNEDGSWSDPIDMGPEVNTPAGENCPQVTPDGKYFFFNRYDRESDVGNMYWVDARVLDDLRAGR